MNQTAWKSIKRLAKVSAAMTFFVFSVACSHEGIQEDTKSQPQSLEPMSAEEAPPVVEPPLVQEPLNSKSTWPAPTKTASHRALYKHANHKHGTHKHRTSSSNLAAHKSKLKSHKKGTALAKHVKPKPIETNNTSASSATTMPASSGTIQDQASQMQLPPPPPVSALPTHSPTSELSAENANGGGGILEFLTTNWAYGVFGLGLVGALAWVANSRRGGRSSKSRGLVFNA